MECDEGIYHGCHRNNGEEPGGDLAYFVAKVEEANGKTAEDDGEVEPGEEGTLIGEEDLGLDSGRECNALACALSVTVPLIFALSVSPGAVWRRGCDDMMGVGQLCISPVEAQGLPDQCLSLVSSP